MNELTDAEIAAVLARGRVVRQSATRRGGAL
jgi:hypothetical protein